MAWEKAAGYKDVPRNLAKNKLGGVIFLCSSITMKECLDKQLFGLPSSQFSYVRQIEEGMPLFLFNYHEKVLYGIFEAASSGRLNIDAYAWTDDGAYRTEFPAQVRVRYRCRCKGLPENLFKTIIIDNYVDQVHFKLELDHAQASKLIAKFSSSDPRPRDHRGPPKVVLRFPPSVKLDNSEAEHDFGSSDESSKPSKVEWHVSSEFSDDHMSLDGSNKSTAADLEVKTLIYEKLKELAESCTSTENIEERVSVNTDHDMDPFEKVSLENESLKIQLAEAENEKNQLKKRIAFLESRCDSFSREGTRTPSHDSVSCKSNESILVVGGFDGESWSSSVSSFVTSHDALKSRKSLSSVRGSACVAKLDGEIYVFGGGDGCTWYDTVESYNSTKDEWTLRPSLKMPKGSLGGASLNGKLFAIGGGNGVECFSDVEMFDPNVGRWIYSRSLLEKRFAVAAVELNGAIYASGGFDGHNYLRTVERFDPREHNWTRIEPMLTKRGCLALVAMNEKLYALGGFDGDNMVSSTEIYDPRLGVWMAGEPMNHERGYLAAAVAKDTIYAIGGVRTDHEIVEKIECYKEDGTWVEANLRAVGKRCFACAIPFDGK